MARGQDIRNASKADVEWGKWESGKMPRSAFSLSRPRSRAFRLGSAYRWRVVRFSALDLSFRLLIAFCSYKEQYRATLALEQGRDLSIVASYEFHGTHPGWHMQATCGDVDDIPAGMMRGPWQTRYPKARQHHRRTEFGISSEEVALEFASRFFRLHKAEDKML